MNQGGLIMELTPTPGAPEPRHTWAAWLRAAMTRHYGEGFLNKQLADDTGNVIREQSVSRWLGAKINAPDVKAVRLVAATLRGNLAEALIAAGYGELVEEVRSSLVQTATESPARAKTEDELRRELAALQDDVNSRINELRSRLDRGNRSTPQRPTGNGQAS